MSTSALTQRQKIVFAAAVAVLLLFLAARLINGLSARNLVLTIAPSGATVKIDNVVRSGTSFSLDATSHDLSITKDGYLPKNTIVTITEGKKTTLSINLVKKTPSSLTEYVFRDTIYPDYPRQELKVLSTEQLYGGTWILGTVLIGSEEEKVVVLQKDDSDTGYKLYLTGPPFDQSKFTVLPEDVRTEITKTSMEAAE